jgi:hypothetical protein
VAFRRDIGKFLRDISPRIDTFSIGPVSIQLAEMSPFEPNWKGYDMEDFRKSSIHVDMDSRAELLWQLSEPQAADYAIFDLGSGSEWLSSRLYLFALILQRMRRIRYIVFVDRNQGVMRHFVGIADSEILRYVFAQRYEWLEQSLAKAYGKLEQLRISTNYGSFDSYSARTLINDFINEINAKEEYVKSLDPSEQGQWVKLPQSHTWERAEWIDVNKLESILGDLLWRPWVIDRELQTKPKQEQVKSIIAFKESVVAIVDADRRFEKLIDRYALTDQAAHTLMLE